jgi:hypothetical protein
MSLTPEQFNRIALKEDVEKIVENQLQEVKENINKVLTAVDAIAKGYADHNIEHISNIRAHDRFETRLNRHGRKIKKLETVV